jgi:hypothetical protein
MEKIVAAKGLVNGVALFGDPLSGIAGQGVSHVNQRGVKENFWPPMAASYINPPLV